MTYSILLVFEKPDVRIPDIGSKWREFSEELTDISISSIDVQQLAENVLLIALGDTLNNLSEILSLSGHLPYKYSIFSESIEWHEVSNT